MKRIKKTRVELESKIRELESMFINALHFASMTLPKMSTEHFKGSGVVVCLYRVGGNEATPPFFIRNGFSQATIDALQGDLASSYEYATEFKPKNIVGKEKKNETD